MKSTCLLIAAAFVLGCDMPRDMNGTHSLVSGGKIRVGISVRDPWTIENEGHYSGVEAELIQKLAKKLNAKPQWQLGSESELFEQLHHGELDVVIGGITEDTPWSDRVGLTRPYVEAIDPVTGKSKKHVWAVTAGENRWLLELDKFLQENRSEAALRALEVKQ